MTEKKDWTDYVVNAINAISKIFASIITAFLMFFYHVGKNSYKKIDEDWEKDNKNGKK